MNKDCCCEIERKRGERERGRGRERERERERERLLVKFGRERTKCKKSVPTQSEFPFHLHMVADVHATNSCMLSLAAFFVSFTISQCTKNKRCIKRKGRTGKE